MATLTPKEIADFEKRLHEQREMLRWRIHDALLENKREDYAELAGRVHDAAEESVAELVASTHLLILEREVAELREVEAALERIAEGTYGRCRRCGSDIGRERLEAYPAATRCVDCQRLCEQERAGGRDLTPSL